jgi:hypothetical protein
MLLLKVAQGERFIIFFILYCQEKNRAAGKIFLLRSSRLLIVLWTLMGKRSLSLTKRELSTAVDNFLSLAVLLK